MLVKNKGYPKGERIFKMEVFLIMKKKFFAVALATTMAVSTVMTASAETISGAWWTSWSQGYEVADGETVEFDMELKGGDAVWNNVAAVFVNGKTTGTTAPADEVAGYKEYAVVRGDNWGWGGGDNKTVDGNDISYQGGIADLGDADFIATMKDAHLEVSVTREGNDIEYTYTAIGANGIETTRTVNFTSDLSEGCYVFFVSDGSTVEPFDFGVIFICGGGEPPGGFDIAPPQTGHFIALSGIFTLQFGHFMVFYLLSILLQIPSTI